MTGTACISPETMAKGMQLLKEVVPRARHVAILWANASLTSQFGQVLRTSLDRAAGNLDLRNRYFEIRHPEDVAAPLDEISSSNVDALWYQGSPVLRTREEQIFATLLKRRLPSFANIPLFAERGGLVHYAPDVEEFFSRTAGSAAMGMATSLFGWHLTKQSTSDCQVLLYASENNRALAPISSGPEPCSKP